MSTDEKIHTAHDAERLIASAVEEARKGERRARDCGIVPNDEGEYDGCRNLPTAFLCDACATRAAIAMAVEEARKEERGRVLAEELSSLICDLDPKDPEYQRIVQIYERRNGIPERIPWTAEDREKLRRLLKDQKPREPSGNSGGLPQRPAGVVADLRSDGGEAVYPVRDAVSTPADITTTVLDNGVVSHPAVDDPAELDDLFDERVVCGMRMERSIADFVRVCEAIIEEQSASACGDTAIVGVLCDAVRLARRHVRMATSTLRSSGDPVPLVDAGTRKALELCVEQVLSTPVRGPGGYECGCARCGDPYEFDNGADPTALCHPCAQEAATKMATALRSILDAPPPPPQPSPALLAAVKEFREADRAAEGVSLDAEDAFRVANNRRCEAARQLARSVEESR